LAKKRGEEDSLKKKTEKNPRGVCTNGKFDPSLGERRGGGETRVEKIEGQERKVKREKKRKRKNGMGQVRKVRLEKR